MEWEVWRPHANAFQESKKNFENNFNRNTHCRLQYLYFILKDITILQIKILLQISNRMEIIQNIIKIKKQP